MILPKDIFTTSKEHIKFLLYLYSEKTFNINEVSSAFNISKWVLYKQVRYWKVQNYVTIVASVGKIGGKQYQYQVTDKLTFLLKEFLSMLLKKLDLKEVDSENL
jgi:predicted transcriptional regulator